MSNTLALAGQSRARSGGFHKWFMAMLSNPPICGISSISAYNPGSKWDAQSTSASSASSASFTFFLFFFSGLSVAMPPKPPANTQHCPQSVKSGHAGHAVPKKNHGCSIYPWLRKRLTSAPTNKKYQRLVRKRRRCQKIPKGLIQNLTGVFMGRTNSARAMKNTPNPSHYTGWLIGSGMSD